MACSREKAKAEESPADKEARMKERRDQRTADKLKTTLQKWLSKKIDSFVPEYGSAEDGYSTYSI